MSKKSVTDSSKEDGELFRQTVGQVRRVDHNHVEPEPRGSTPQPRRTPDGEADDVDHSEETSFHRPGIQRAVLRRLRRGHYGMADELDLHGMTQREAQAALDEFFEEAARKRSRSVRIIHGKGRHSSRNVSVLRPMVYGWLRRRAEVVAYCAAAIGDGGGGAVVVLLRER